MNSAAKLPAGAESRRYLTLENRNVTTQQPTKTPDDETTENPKVPIRVEIPDISEREEFESVDDPGAAEEPDGYGHGV